MLLKNKCVFVLFLACLFFSPSCTTHSNVSVIDLDKMQPELLDKSRSIDVYMLGQNPNVAFKHIESINTISKKALFSKKATKSEALAQAKAICVQKKGDALINVSFEYDGGKTTDWILLSADIVKFN
jgi:hypothetical protein